MKISCVHSSADTLTETMTDFEMWNAYANFCQRRVLSLCQLARRFGRSAYSQLVRPWTISHLWTRADEMFRVLLQQLLGPNQTSNLVCFIQFLSPLLFEVQESQILVNDSMDRRFCNTSLSCNLFDRSMRAWSLLDSSPSRLQCWRFAEYGIIAVTTALLSFRRSRRVNLSQEFIESWMRPISVRKFS